MINTNRQLDVFIRKHKKLESQKAEAPFRLSVPLKHITELSSDEMHWPDQLNAILQHEYIVRYLERLGVPPSRQAIKFVRENRMRLDQLEIVHDHQLGRAHITPVPLLSRFSRIDPWTASPDEILTHSVPQLPPPSTDAQLSKEEAEQKRMEEELYASGDLPRFSYPHFVRVNVLPARLQYLAARSPHDYKHRTTPRHSTDLTPASARSRPSSANKTGSFAFPDRKVSELQQDDDEVGADELRALQSASDEDGNSDNAERSPLSFLVPLLRSNAGLSLKKSGTQRSGLNGSATANASHTPLSPRSCRSFKRVRNEVVVRFPKQVSELLRRGPLVISQQHVEQLVTEFVGQFPFKEFRQQYDEEQMSDLVDVLSSELMVKFVQTLCRYMYWKMFSSFCPATHRRKAGNWRLDVYTLQRLHTQLERQIRRHRHHTLFLLPLYLDALWGIVGHTFLRAYPSWFRSELGAPTQREMERQIDHMFNSIADLDACVPLPRVNQHLKVRDARIPFPRRRKPRRRKGIARAAQWQEEEKELSNAAEVEDDARQLHLQNRLAPSRDQQQHRLYHIYHGTSHLVHTVFGHEKARVQHNRRRGKGNLKPSSAGSGQATRSKSSRGASGGPRHQQKVRSSSALGVRSRPRRARTSNQLTGASDDVNDSLRSTASPGKFGRAMTRLSRAGRVYARPVSSEDFAERQRLYKVALRRIEQRHKHSRTEHKRYFDKAQAIRSRSRTPGPSRQLRVRVSSAQPTSTTIRRGAAATRSKPPTRSASHLGHREDAGHWTTPRATLLAGGSDLLERRRSRTRAEHRR